MQFIKPIKKLIKPYIDTEIKLDYIINENYLFIHLNEFFKSLNSTTQYIAIITKVETDNKDHYSLGNKIILDIHNEKEISNYVNYVITKFNDHFPISYDPKLVVKLIFSYRITTKESFSNYARKQNRHNDLLLDKNILEGISDKHNVPFNNFYHTWGDVKFITSSQYTIINVYFNKNIKSITVNNIGNLRSQLLITFFDINNDSINFTDIIQEDGHVKRIYNNNSGMLHLWYIFNPVLQQPHLQVSQKKLPKIYSKDNTGKENLENRLHIIRKVQNYTDKEINLKTLQKENSSQINKIKTPKIKIITLDCETYVENNEFKLLSVCFFDGKKEFKFYITDFKSNIDLLNYCFDRIFIKRYSGYNIYIHNGAKFDIVLLLNYLLSRKDITINNVLYKDGKFLQLNIKKTINIKVNNTSKKINLNYNFKDSYLILQNSLANLGKSFNVEVQKDIFPYYFPNSTNLLYDGPIPSDYLYYDLKKVNFIEYQNYIERFSNKNWNLKNVVLDYCIKDCISLYQVLSKFKTLIDTKFKVDMQTCPTITSLAFKIFKANYYNPLVTPIPLLSKEIYDDLSKAFYGGHVDMYIPEGPKDNGSLIEVLKKYDALEDKSIENIKKNFKTIKHYDINSLYPSSMIANKYPTDIICELIGDPKLDKETLNLYENQVGIYKVKVVAPDIKHPLLPTKIGGTSLYGSGQWTGWYYSEELKNAEKYGYTISILGGYIFESHEIFNNYINDLYEIKENSTKGTAMYLIGKLLLNSLYGRLGMNPFLPKAKFMPIDKYNELVNKGIIDPLDVDTKNFETHVLVVTSNNYSEFSDCEGNVAVALAVTANARIRMSTIKNNPKIKLYYTDTDSGFIEDYLPEELTDPKKIGYWSLENEYIYSTFLGPKTYGCLDVNGESYSKIKGYSSTVSLEELNELLNKNEIKKLNQSKWKTFLTESKILIKSTTYDLVATDNKRELVFDNNRLIATKNKKIKENTIE